ncbi:MAG: glycosyltransferase family 4 protein [Mariniphaga sp.]|nr:glycosyltransferase family 4 protein [Mariniphaga sp.]
MIPVLIITYYWPPAGGPGVQRILKFVKYLPQFGIQPHVLTIENGDYPAYDYSLTDEISDEIDVVKINGWEPYNSFRFFMRQKKKERIPVGYLIQSNKSFVNKILSWIRLNIFIPDGRLFLINPFYRCGKRLIEKENIKAIISTGPPHSLHISALRLQNKFHLPWIADFRDPWTKIFYYMNQKRSALTKKIDSYLERKIILSANRVITVSPFLARQLQLSNIQNSVVTIFNGFDAEDFPEQISNTDNPKFQIAYIGNFKSNQSIENLWLSLSELIADDRQFSNDLNLLFVGNVHTKVNEAIQSSGLSKHIDQKDYVPHHEAISYMQQASVLLFIVPNVVGNSGIITGKLFDYLAAQRPILAIGPVDGDASQILLKSVAGKMINPDNKFALKKKIELLYQLWRDDLLQEKIPEKRAINQFERRQQTKSLSNLINELCNNETN